MAVIEKVKPLPGEKIYVENSTDEKKTENSVQDLTQRIKPVRNMR